MIKDTKFYNRESGMYSDKRYPKVSSTYTQFFFKRRLQIVLRMLRPIVLGKSNLRIIEIGSADGIVLRTVYDTFKSHVGVCKGIDLSPSMIDAAKNLNGVRPIEYSVRNFVFFPDSVTYDIVLEIGVINYTDFDEEIAVISKILSREGVCLISLAGRNSVWDVLRKGDTGFKNFLKYLEYEKKLRELFTIKSVAVTGLYIPLIWRIPPVARVIQNCVEAMLGKIVPYLFHEKIYLLSLKETKKTD